MSNSWLIYTTASRPAAESAVEAMYETLGGIVGEDLAEHLDPGEELEPPSLGSWPDVSVFAKGKVPTADEARATATAGGKTNAKLEDAAIERLAKCRTVVQIEGPAAFDPAHVSALRALFDSLGPCVFTERQGVDLSTSESVLKRLAASADLATKLRAVAAGETDDDDDEDEDEDDEDEDDEDDDDDDEDDDEPAPDSARPETLRMILGEIAQLPRARRKAAELLGGAPPIVGRFAERLARVGAEPDPAVAQALGVTEKDVIGARKALAILLRRAESR